MTRKKAFGRCMVTCGRMFPSPYLVRQWDRSIREYIVPGRALDLGCGNGRNSVFLERQGMKDVVSVDACHELPEHRLLLGKDRLPVADESASLVLLNYVLMFLSEAELEGLALEVERVAKRGCLMVLEMYPAKDSRCRTDGDCERRLVEFRRLLLARQSWHNAHAVKNRRVLRRV